MNADHERHRVLGTPIRLVLSVGGLGFSPVAPGTIGSLPPVVVALLLGTIMGTHWSIEVALLLFGIFGVVACVRFAGVAERAGGREDPGWIVADEVAGQSIALAALPWIAWQDGGFGRNIALAAIAFAAFRVFDIVKPPPIKRIERIGGGWGILLDDVVAGVWALIVTQLLVWLLF